MRRGNCWIVPVAKEIRCGNAARLVGFDQKRTELKPGASWSGVGESERVG